MIEMNTVPKAQTASLKPKEKSKNDDKSFLNALTNQLSKEKPELSKENEVDKSQPKDSQVNASVLQNILALMQADSVISADMKPVFVQEQGDLSILPQTQQSGQVLVDMAMPSIPVPVEAITSMQQTTQPVQNLVMPTAEQTVEVVPNIVQQTVTPEMVNAPNVQPVVAVMNEDVVEKPIEVAKTPIIQVESKTGTEKLDVPQQPNAVPAMTEKASEPKLENMQVVQQTEMKLVENEDAKPADENKSNQLIEPDMLETKPITIVRDTGFVKISDVASKLDVPPQQQIVDNIKVNLHNDKSEFTMQLFPENLGKVCVKMVAEKGMITIELVADNPKTQSLLLSNANEIKELVQASTATNTHVVASNQNESLQQNYTQQQADKENQQNHHAEQNQETKENEETVAIDFTSLLEQMKQSVQRNRFSI